MTTTSAVNPVLQRTWGRPSTLIGWLTAVNHRAVGLRYIITGLVFFALAGLGALAIRIQLIVPLNNFLDPDLYNQLFTMHGTTMMFLFAIPIMEGVGIYIMPLMIGARDMAFPRLNAFGYWIYLISGLVLWFSLLIGEAPDGGWFAYVPLTGPQFSPGLGIDFYATMITFLELAALVAAVELIVTIFTLRAPGMSLNRIPLFVWAILVMAFMILFAMPAIIVGSAELMLDRLIGTDFFNPQAGGAPLLWQHLFWFFGHPEVYIIFLPALGIVSAIVPTFTRRPMVGYNFIVLAFVGLGFGSFGLWVHHMFTTGLPDLSLSFFNVASFLIAFPSAIQIFATLATLWTGKIWLRTPLLFVLGFIVVFVIGGITGVMVGSIPLDWQVHGTYFIVAHFHYVLIGGAVFPLFGGLYYWWPKFTGRLLDESLGRWHFWLLFAGFHVTFFPMHITGLLGMPRRVYTYLPGLGWEELNFISTIGAFMIALSILIFSINIFKTIQSGRQAGDNPWNAGTLEWATSSPPPPYNFENTPAVNSRQPLWTFDAPGARTEQMMVDSKATFGLLSERRETLGTSILDAVPQQRVILPGPTLIPLLAALAVAFTFISLMIDLRLVPIGAVLVAAALIMWQWPTSEEQTMDYAESGPVEALPTDVTGLSQGIYPPFFWGLLGLLAIETAVFVSLIVSYLYLRAANTEWPLDGIEPPGLLLPIIELVVLIASAIPIYWSDVRISQHGDQRALRWGYVIGSGLVVLFIVLRAIEIYNLDFNWASNAYSSIFWTMIGLHTMHSIALLVSSLAVMVLVFKGYFNQKRFAGIRIDGVYWYFVAAIWIPAFITLYLLPRWL